MPYIANLFTFVTVFLIGGFTIFLIKEMVTGLLKRS